MQFSVAAQCISEPRRVPRGAVVTVTPGTGATATIEYTLDGAAAVMNNVATWAPWRLGSVTTTKSDLVGDSAWIRVKATGGAVDVLVDESPNEGSLIAYRADWGAGDSSGDTPDTPSPGVDATDVGYDIVLCAGQSNMEGNPAWDSAIDSITDGRVHQFGGSSSDSATYRKIVAGNDPMFMYNGPRTGFVGPASYFGRAYASSIPINRRVLLVPVAAGSTGIIGGGALWAPGSPGGTLYELAITQANLAIAAALALYPQSRFVGVIWAQGESDNAQGQAAYATALKTLIAGFRARITGAANSWFIISGMVPENIAANPSTYGAIDLAHKQVATETDRCKFVAGPSGFAAGVHYTAPGIRIQGTRLGLAAREAAEYIANQPEQPAADTTAPTLTSPTGAATGTTTASGAVTTNEGNGTLYYLASTNATETVATVKASGATQAISSTGSKSVNVTGLSASTQYYLHYVHRDAAGNDSARVTSASFTTSAAGDTTAPVLSSPTGTKTGSSTANGSVVTDEANGTLYYLASTNSTESAATVKASGQTVTVNATGVQNVSHTGLAASTTYYEHFLHRDAAGNDSAVVSSAGYTTDAASATYATWNPADIGSTVALSNGNLTMTKTGGTSGYVSARANTGKSAGKWYWENTVQVAAPFMVGVGKLAAVLNDFVGRADGWGYFSTSGNKFNGGSSAAYGATYAVGDVIGVALDMDAGTLTFYKNGVSQGVAYSGLTGTLYPMSTVNAVLPNAAITTNFGATAFAHTPPAGHTGLTT